MTDTAVEVSSPGPEPTSDDYVGCFSDMVGDRVLTTVTTDDALTPAVSVFSRVVISTIFSLADWSSVARTLCYVGCCTPPTINRSCWLAVGAVIRFPNPV